MNKVILSVAVFLLAISSSLAQSNLTNQLIWASPEFSGEFYGGLNSMNDGNHYTVLEESDAVGASIVKYSYLTGEKVAVVATAKDIFGNTDIAIDDYAFSKDETKLLIQTETESIYRHSFYAIYYVHDLTTKKTTPISDKGKGKQRLAEFSPDGSKVAFVRDNNIFFVDLALKQEEQVTRDGENNKIINGATDWVYEEEFAFDKGFQWSPKSNRIAYYKFDESKVKEFGMDMYGELYPERYTFKYPKAGEVNSTVSIHVYDVISTADRRLDLGSDNDIYIPRIKWTNNNDALCVMRLNRHQNHLEFLVTDLSLIQPFDIALKSIYDEKADTYIDVNDALSFLADGTGFVWNSERNGYNHLYHFDMTGKVVTQLTMGAWDVVDFYGFEPSTQTVYFSSSEVSATEKHVYSCTFKKGKVKTNKLSTKAGVNDATFSKGFKYYILNHSDANTPTTFSLHDQSGKMIRSLVDNSALNERLKKYNLTKREFFTFKNSDGIDLNCWMMKPTNFDSNKKYPVLVAIYGGPGHNTVMNQWEGRNMMWHQLLCQEGYIVVSVDPRGTQYRGRDFKHATYMNLGKLETNDFIDFAKYLGQQSYVDSKRIGMQGWSYGGYMTSLCMTKGADYYTAGIAVAPVTNWKYYDSVYTERFMRTPQENSGGYENNSPINFVSALKGKYLLVHGSADDNVHFQNTMDMITALVKANKQFDLFVYPNKNHGISGGTTRLHLFTKMTDYLKTNL
jgi:dipeptidyl-peptidase 4